VIELCGWCENSARKAQNLQLKEACDKAIENDSSLPGSYLRASVMAALHQDIRLAEHYVAGREIKKLYNESTANILFYQDVLAFMKALQNHPASKSKHYQSLMGKTEESPKLENLSTLESTVNNPYLRLFYQLMHNKDQFKVFEEYALGDTATINVFDFLALAHKYLPREQLKQILDLKITHSVQKGNLDAIVLLGLTQN
jgi:hypothetical protein